MTSQAPPEPDLPAAPQMMPSGPLKPSGAWYILGVLLIFAAVVAPVVVAGTGLGRFGRKVAHAAEEDPVILEADVPGQHDVDLAFAGRYEIVYQYSGTVAGSQYDTPPHLPGLQVELTDPATGEAIPLKPHLAPPDEAHHEFNREFNHVSRGQVKLWEFDVDKAGTYQLKLSYRDPGEGPGRIVLLVRPDLTHAFPSRFFDMWRVMMLTGVGAFGLLAVGVTVLIVVGIKRSSYQRQLLAQSPELPS